MKNSVHNDPFLEVDLTLVTPGGGQPLAADDDPAGSASDALLAARARAGDGEAFGLLYERHRDSVARVAGRWLLDKDAVEDAVQEVFFKAWRALDQFVYGADAGRWLRHIAKNHCHDVWRASRRRPFELTAEGVLDGIASETAPDHLDSIAVRAMLAGLAPRDAALLVQRHVTELPVPTLAERWGLTRAATDVALHRARVRARRLATAQGLRSLLPGPLLRRGKTLYQRFSGSCCDAMAVVGEATAPLLIVAGLTLPTLGTAAADPLPPAPPPPAAAPVLQQASPGAMAHELPLVVEDTPAAAREATSGLRRPATAQPAAAPAPAARPQERTPADDADDFEPVDIPGTGRQLRQSPSQKPDQEVGVRVEPLNEEASTTVANEPTLKPVDDTACTAAEAGQPVGTFCKGGPSD